MTLSGTDAILPGMKAVLVTSPKKLEIGEMAIPKPGEYEVLCELLYGATCTGTDTHIIEGIFPFSSPFPTVLGHESVGRVVEVGGRVENFAPGDIVTRVGTPPDPNAGITTTFGGFSEYGLAKDHWAMAAEGLPESEWRSGRVNQILPRGIDPKIGPMFTPWRETLSAVRRLGVKSGASLLVIGSGGNGLAIAAHAVLEGAGPVVMVGAERNTKAAELCGVHEYIDFRAEGWTDLLKGNYSEGFDFTVDALGRAEVAEQAVRFVKPGGTVGIYGVDEYPGVSVSPFSAAGAFVLSRMPYDESETHQAVSERVLMGKLDASAWYDLDNPYPMVDISVAFDDLWEKRGIKALISIA